MGFMKSIAEEANKRKEEAEKWAEKDANIKKLPKNYKGKFWEYLVISSPLGGYATTKGNSSYKELDELGKVGWELVGMSSLTTAALGGVRFQLIFKREISKGSWK